MKRRFNMEYLVLFGIFYLLNKISKKKEETVEIVENYDDIKTIINKAIAKRKKLSISYERFLNDMDHTILTKRTILPLKLASGDAFVGKRYELKANELYLNAICELRGEERHFRLDRIVSAKILN